MKFLSRVAVALSMSFVLAAPAFSAKSHSNKSTTTATQAAPADSTPVPPNASNAAQPDLPTPNAVPHAGPGALNVPVPPPPSLSAKSWVLTDYATGQVLADSNADERVEPASITKVMTAYVVSAELAAGFLDSERQSANDRGAGKLHW